MDYIFRWLQLRFLTGQQQALFDGLRPKYVNAPPPGVPDENGYGAGSPSGVIPSEGASATSSRDPYSGNNAFPDNRQPTTDNLFTRHVHASDALKELIDMGDSPVCSVCGAIMTRNGSCYRCNECGSTSGCS